MKELTQRQWDWLLEHTAEAVNGNWEKWTENNSRWWLRWKAQMAENLYIEESGKAVNEQYYALYKAESVQEMREWYDMADESRQKAAQYKAFHEYILSRITEEEVYDKYCLRDILGNPALNSGRTWTTRSNY